MHSCMVRTGASLLSCVAARQMATGRRDRGTDREQALAGLVCDRIGVLWKARGPQEAGLYGTRGQQVKGQAVLALGQRGYAVLHLAGKVGAMGGHTLLGARGRRHSESGAEGGGEAATRSRGGGRAEGSRVQHESTALMGGTSGSRGPAVAEVRFGCASGHRLRRREWVW